MGSLNKVMLIGNVGGNPEARMTQDGLEVVRFSLATNEHWKDKQTGERREKAVWHRITAMGKMAELCKSYVKKGSKVFVNGTISYSNYEKDGHKFQSTDILLKSILFLDSKEATLGVTHPADGSHDDAIPF